MTRIKNSPALIVALVVAVIAVLWLAFGYFGIQAAFIDNEVDEGGPVFTASVAEQDAVAETDEFQEAMAEAEENVTEASAEDGEMPVSAESTDDAAGSTDDAAESTAPPEIVTIASGDFSGESRYEITGDALVLNDGSEQRFLRFENFESSNGPDLKVYLRAANGDFVSLGDLKGNIGDQNYEIPVDVDLSVFSTVEIWCERFGVGFGGAELVIA